MNNDRKNNQEISMFNVETFEDKESPFYGRFGDKCVKAVIGKDPNAYFRFLIVLDSDFDKITDNDIILGDMKELINGNSNGFIYVYELGPDTYYSACCIKEFMSCISSSGNYGEEKLPAVFFTVNNDENSPNNPNAYRLEEIHLSLLVGGFFDIDIINRCENTAFYLLADYNIRRSIFKKYFIREYKFEQNKKNVHNPANE